MLNWLAAALIATACCVEGACAQQTLVDPSPAPSPSAAAEARSAPEAAPQDDPTDSADWAGRLSAARQRHAAWLACIAAQGPECTPAPDADADAETNAEVMERLLNDDTLVKGDVVSTPSGLKVFRGQSTVPHSLADFE